MGERENFALAAFCEHDVLYGAHVIRSDEAREIVAASQFLDPGRSDYLQVVPTLRVRTSLKPCGACGFAGGRETA